MLKTYATAISIVLTFAIGCVSSATVPSIGFLQGLAMVIASIFLYSLPSKPKEATSPPPPNDDAAAAEDDG